MAKPKPFDVNMRIYIISNKKAILCVNGLPKLKISCNLSCFDITNKNKINLSFIPESVDISPVFYYGNLTPYESAELSFIDLYGDLLIIVEFSEKPVYPLQGTIYESIKEGVTAGIYKDVFYKIILSNGDKRTVKIIKNISDNAKAECEKINNLIFVFIQDEKNHLYLFNATTLDVVFERCDVINFNYDEKYFYITTAPVTVCDIKMKYVFNVLSCECEKAYSERTICIDKLNENIIPYAFLEEVMLNTEYADYLSDELKVKQEYIPGYFGKFRFFVPYKLNNAIICYKGKKGYKKAAIVFFELSDRKICDISFL